MFCLSKKRTKKQNMQKEGEAEQLEWTKSLCTTTVPELLKNFQETVLVPLLADERLTLVESFPLGLPSPENLSERVNHLKNLKTVVLVMGEMKAGKSTFLTSLLWPLNLPSDVNPCSSNLCRIRYGHSPKAVVHPHQGHPVEIDLGGLDSEQTIHKLRDYLVQKGNRNQEFSIKVVEIFVNHPLLEHGLIFVDTPGLNENDYATKQTVKALEEAHAVFLLLSCNSGGITQVLINTFQESKGDGKATTIQERLIRQDESSVYLIGTWIDSVKGDVNYSLNGNGVNWEELEQKRNEEARLKKKQFFVEQFSQLLNRPYSVDDDQCHFINGREILKQKQLKSELPAEYNRLEASLMKNVISRRYYISARTELIKLEQNLLQVEIILKQLIAALTTGAEERATEINTIEESLKEIIVQEKEARVSLSEQVETQEKILKIKVEAMWKEEIAKPVLKVFDKPSAAAETAKQHACRLKDEADQKIKTLILAVTKDQLSKMMETAMNEMLQCATEKLTFINLVLDDNPSFSVSISSENLPQPDLNRMARLLLTPVGILGGGGALVAAGILIGVAALPVAILGTAGAVTGGLFARIAAHLWPSSTNSAQENIKAMVSNHLEQLKVKFFKTIELAIRQELENLQTDILKAAVRIIEVKRMRLETLKRIKGDHKRGDHGMTQLHDLLFQNSRIKEQVNNLQAELAAF